MRFSTTLLAVITAASSLTSVFAAPTAPLRTVQAFAGERKPGSFVVTLKGGADKAKTLQWLQNQPGTATVTNDWDEKFVNGFAGDLDTDALNALRTSPDVDLIAEDGIMHTFVTQTQNNAPWGLARVSQNGRVANQNPLSLTNTYRFDSTAGRGVDVYVVDTGINTAHVEFGGRATFGATFGPYASRDGNGHGTHCAGTVASNAYGVAKGANVIAVKVLGDDGSGTVSDIISGLNFVATQARQTGRPSIVSMSLGGGVSTALDNAVAALTNAGVHVVIAAGNSNTNAANTSPARAPSAITVGASTISDTRASFSNFGAVVDVFAPGQDITSTWIDSNTDTNTISGTSMATPHVAGMVAYLIGLRGNVSPAAMSTLIKSLSVKNGLSGVPSGTLNDLLRNDIA